MHRHLPPSPAFLRLLYKTFTTDEVQLVLKAYEDKGEKIGGDIFNRGEASFNPRICRVIQILIEECGVADLPSVLNSIEELTTDPILPINTQSAVMYADILDRIRHAHFHLKKEENATLVSFAINLSSGKYPKVHSKILHLTSKKREGSSYV